MLRRVARGQNPSGSRRYFAAAMMWGTAWWARFVMGPGMIPTPTTNTKARPNPSLVPHGTVRRGGCVGASPSVSSDDVHGDHDPQVQERGDDRGEHGDQRQRVRSAPSTAASIT